MSVVAVAGVVAGSAAGLAIAAYVTSQAVLSWHRTRAEARASLAHEAFMAMGSDAGTAADPESPPLIVTGVVFLPADTHDVAAEHVVAIPVESAAIESLIV